MSGVGTMLDHLPAEYIGRRIKTVSLSSEEVRIKFEDSSAVRLWDSGQTCCESRYMTSDDDLFTLVGHTLQRIEAKDGPTTNEDAEPHETCFIEIGTDVGFVTITNHNEHNGYYGGFGLALEAV